MKHLLSFGLLGLSFTLSLQAASVELAATMIFDKGPNVFKGEVLEITKGRGANIGWYLKSDKACEVTVLAEYACEAPLNQAYQLSFDGSDVFWEVQPTKKKNFEQARLGTFQLRAGLPVLVLLVPPSGTKYPQPVRFRRLIIQAPDEAKVTQTTAPVEPPAPDATPGFGQKLNALHPSLKAIDWRDEKQTHRISGMALRGETELLFTTWDGDLFSVELTSLKQTKRAPAFKRLARGLSEPMGLAVDEGRVFVTEKNEVTELIDEDGDSLFETFHCVSHDWPCSMDYHEYLFGAVIQKGHVYFCNSVGMSRRSIDNHQVPLRGSLIRVNIDTGHTEILAGGLRTPDGVGVDSDGTILVTDNQGEWLPGNKLIRMKEGEFYQFRSTPPRHPLDRSKTAPPTVWLPQGEIASSPTQPVVIPESWGPYAGHILFGDAAFGGLQRAFLETVDGVSQGAVFPFSQGLRHLPHRFVFSSEGRLWLGGIARGADQEFIHRVSGLTEVRFTGKTAFEPLAARLHSDGIEIEFTQPLAEGEGWDQAAYLAHQWGYQATQTYGGQKVRPRSVKILSASVSPDRRSVFLQMEALAAQEVLHVRMAYTLLSASDQPLWAGEFWYTINQLPSRQMGPRHPRPNEVKTQSTPYFTYSAGNEGKVLFNNFCSACHSLGDTKLAGPTLGGIPGTKRLVRDPATGLKEEVDATAEYLRQSILEPNALIVDGYPENLMPPIGAILSSAQIDALVDYIMQAAKAGKK